VGFGAGSEGGRGWGGDGRLLNVVCVCAFLEVSSVGVQTRAGAVRDCRLWRLWPEGVRTTERARVWRSRNKKKNTIRCTIR